MVTMYHYKITLSFQNTAIFVK